MMLLNCLLIIYNLDGNGIQRDHNINPDLTHLVHVTTANLMQQLLKIFAKEFVS